MDRTSGTARLGGIDRLAQEVSDDAYRTAKRLYDMAPGASPIEKLFWTALRVTAGLKHRCIDEIYSVAGYSDFATAQDVASRMSNVFSTAFIEMQVEVAGWRVDFLLHYPSILVWQPGMPLHQLIVECDGHDFHERTKEQAARDRSRDRIAQYQGIPILRFTGSEIWNDPMRCADEVLAFMERA